MTSEDNFIPARKVLDRYGISDMALWRWLHDATMGFPQPARRINKRRYWRLSDLQAWDAKQV